MFLLSPKVKLGLPPMSQHLASCWTFATSTTRILGSFGNSCRSLYIFIGLCHIIGANLIFSTVFYCHSQPCKLLNVLTDVRQTPSVQTAGVRVKRLSLLQSFLLLSPFSLSLSLTVSPFSLRGFSPGRLSESTGFGVS